MLGLDLKTVCALADVGKRTLTEFEAGARAINGVTEGKIKAFYISQGISFAPQEQDGEAVRIVDRSEIPAADYKGIAEKAEYSDLFDVDRAIGRIRLLSDMVKSLDAAPSISQSIMMGVMRRSGFRQKDLAASLGCTAAFINAVVTGKKSLPMRYAGDLQEILENESGIDVERALQQEKIINKSLAEMKTLVTLYQSAWHQIHQLT